MRTRPIAFAALLAALAGLAAGCQAETELTFADEANEICEGQYADFANSLALTGVVSNTEEDVKARQEREEASAEATAKLADLEPPDAEAADFRAYLAERFDQQATASQARRALASGARAAFRRADIALAEHDREMHRLETKLGFDVCAQELDDEAVEAVDELLEEAFLEEEPRCRDNFTVRFMREALGVSEAEEDECEPLVDDLLPESVEIAAVRGSEGEIASAEVGLEGGPADGRVIGVRMLYEHEEPVIADVLWISRPRPPAGS